MNQIFSVSTLLLATFLGNIGHATEFQSATLKDCKLRVVHGYGFERKSADLELKPVKCIVDEGELNNNKC